MSNPTDKEPIIDKIRKLLALGKSANKHEAELAMAKASELMTKYQIGMSEVQVDRIRVQTAVSGDGISVSETYRSFVADIAFAAGHIFDVQVVRLTSEQARIAFVGLPEDIKLAEIMFSYLFESWKSIVSVDTKAWKQRYFDDYDDGDKQYETKKYKIGHGQGFSAAVSSRARELVKERKAQVKSSGTQLIVVKDALIKAYMDEHTKPGKDNYKRQGMGYFQGKTRGNEIPLTSALDGKLKIGD